MLVGVADLLKVRIEVDGLRKERIPEKIQIKG